MPNLFDDYDAHNNLTLDFSNEIERAVSEISRAVADAQESKIKDVLREAFEAGVESEFIGRTAPDFEEWYAALVERLRGETP